LATPTTITGAPALALASVVVSYSPIVSPDDKRVLAKLFDGNIVPFHQRIVVKADSIACRTSDVDITERSCKLTFGGYTQGLEGRKADELNATVIQAGILPDGAAGTIFESLTHLVCVIDPNDIK